MQTRLTIQKQVISETLAELKNENGHVSIDEIYTAVSTKYPSISKTTVYRNVRQLAELGEIRKIMLEDKVERYDLNAHDHHHFTCVVCGEIYDVEIDGLFDFGHFLGENYGFSTETAHYSFTGTCERCKETKSVASQSNDV